MCGFLITKSGIVVTDVAAFQRTMSDLASDTAVLAMNNKGEAIVVVSKGADNLNTAVEAAQAAQQNDGNSLAKITASFTFGTAMTAAAGLAGLPEFLVGLLAGKLYEQWWDTSKNFWDNYYGINQPISPMTDLQFAQFQRELRQGYRDTGTACMPPSYATDTKTAKQAIPRRDPLTLDLNGDGIQTVPLSTPPLFFDLTASGVKVSTGWIAPSDGLLVMDRNGNGLIDSGAELFGDATPAYAAGTSSPTTGSGRTVDGFAALAQEDTNGDGLVNNLDTNFASLRVWQDANQDGISQANELKTLTDAGIASFNVSRSTHSQTLANGNQIADLGTFTYSDGRQGNTGFINNLADINLAVDTFHRSFADTIPLTPAAQALPDMQGAGKVRDLQGGAANDELWRVAA